MNSQKKILVTKIAEYTGHKSSIYCLAFHNGKLFSAGSDRLVARWETEDEGISFAASSSAVYSMLFHSEMNVLLLGNADGVIHIIDMDSGKEIRSLKPASTPIFKMISVKEVNKLFVMSGEGMLSVYNNNDLSFVKNIRVSGSKLRAITIDKKNNLIVIGCGEGAIHTFDMKTLERVNYFQAHQQDFSVNCILIHPHSNEIISGSRDGHINVFETYDSESLVRSIPAHNYAVYAMEFVNDNMIITASRDKTLKLWDSNVQDFILKIDSTIGGHKYSINSICVDPENGNIFSAGDDRLIKKWAIEAAS